jgi:flagellar biosynthesis protein FlhB
MMKKNKIVSDNQLKKVFKEFPLEKLPSDFMEDLMQKIEKESVNKRRTQKLIVLLQVIAGIASMLLLPALAIYLCNLFIPGFSFSFSDMNINLNSIAIVLAILPLLIIDSLHKRHVAKREMR